MVASRLTDGRVGRHHDHRLYAQCPRGISHTLPVIAAGIGDDAAAMFFRREGSDLVIGAAQFERADRLKIFRLEVKLAVVFAAISLVDVRRDQFRPDGDAV